jgi:DNA end-binding protein Ku
VAPRSLWNGTLAVGEVIIPIKLFSVVQQHRVQFREVRLSDGARIRHQRVNSESGEEVPPAEIRKAYELEDGRQVVLSDDEIAAAYGPRTKVIQIEHFTDAAQIDPIFYERPYMLGAQAGGERAYVVMRDALERSGKVGIGRFVLRTREQLVAVAPHGDALRLYTMRFADELVRSADLDLPAMEREPTAKEMEMAERLIDALAAAWEPERYEDRHRQAVMAVIESKAAGREVTVPEISAPEPVPDLLAALTQSVEQRKGRRSGAPAATRARRKAPANAANKPTPGSKPKPTAPSKTRSRTS